MTDDKLREIAERHKLREHGHPADLRIDNRVLSAMREAYKLGQREENEACAAIADEENDSLANGFERNTSRRIVKAIRSRIAGKE